MDIQSLLHETVERHASDLHIQVGSPPIIRISGQLTATDHPIVTDADAESFLNVIARSDTLAEMEKSGSADFSFSSNKHDRFRVNVFRQRGALAMVFRSISAQPPPLDSLNLPPVIKDICETERGLVLCTGATGQGKSTTLASMVDYINATRSDRIITIEDPIEYIHHNQKSLVSQRELGSDARSFAEALRHVLRQDPDIILLGELRDLETIRTAIQAAETGHLVFATLHTMDTVQSVDRMISYYPPEEHELIRQQLALNLMAVISQRLIKSEKLNARVPAVEVLRQSPIVQKLLMANKIKELHQAVQNGEQGMQTFDQSLANLVKEGKLSKEEALGAATNVNTLKRIISGGFSDGDRASLINF